MGRFRANDAPVVSSQQARYWSAGIHCNNSMGYIRMVWTGVSVCVYNVQSQHQNTMRKIIKKVLDSVPIVWIMRFTTHSLGNTDGF